MNIATSIKDYSTDWWSYMTKAGRFGGLDLARAAAILMVVVWHISNYAAPFGWSGVDLFFVLSGFLIYTIFKTKNDTQSFTLSSFYKDRFLRIYPTYIAMVMVYIYLQFHHLPLIEIFKSFITHATFTQSYIFMNVVQPYYQDTWSLVVEVAFYAIAPLIFTKFSNRIIPVCIIIAVTFAILRFIIMAQYPADDMNWTYFHLLRPHFRIDELWYGVCLAYIALNFPEKITPVLQRIALVVGLIITAIMWSYFSFVLDAPSLGRMHPTEAAIIPTLNIIGYVLIVTGIYNMRVENKLIIFIARVAYPLYLTHHMTIAHFPNLGVSLLFTAIIAIAVSYCIEYPFIRMYKQKRKVTA